MTAVVCQMCDQEFNRKPSRLASSGVVLCSRPCVKRADNRPANLELWSSFQPPGQRVQDKVVYAREILARYGDLP